MILITYFFKKLRCRRRAIFFFLGIILFAGFFWLMQIVSDSIYDPVPRRCRKYIVFEEQKNASWTSSVLLSEEEAQSLRKIFENRTYRVSDVRHREHFGPVEDHTTVIAIQVHKDIAHLQYLIVSLAAVRGIEDTLLVFSHSFCDPHINRLVQSIDFCKVMQIFYPHSVQMNPGKFPGVDPRDCNSPEMKRAHLENINHACLQRDAHRAEYKHHWWWKAHQIFRYLPWSSNHQGMVIFLDEATYVAPDILHMLQYTTESFKHLPALIASFGGIPGQDLDYSLLLLTAWRPPYDIGIAFNKIAWQRIWSLTPHFCSYNDYSWSYSLMNLLSNFPEKYAETIVSNAPRVLPTDGYSTGRAGYLAAQAVFRGAAALRPERVHVAVRWRAAARVLDVRAPPKARGGWEQRDQLFCINPLVAPKLNDMKVLVRY